MPRGRRPGWVRWVWLALGLLVLSTTVACGWLVLFLRQHGVAPVGPALVAAALLLLSGALLWGIEAAQRDLERRKQAEAVAAEQRNILQSVVDNLGDGVAVADERGRLVLFNPAAERIIGLGVVDSPPGAWTEVYGLFRPDAETPIPTDELPLVRAIAGEECRDVEMFVRNAQNRGGVFIRVTATPLRDREGQVRGGVAVFRDITERKWTETVLRDSEIRFRSIVEATGSAVVILAPDGRILEFNPQAERLYGRPRGAVLGENFFELFLPREYWDAVRSDIDNALSGKPTLDFEVPVQARDGTQRYTLWSMTRLAGAQGKPIGVIATGHDVTERKEAEETQRVRQLAAHLQSARESERKYLAREIHDELGQALTGLKFEFSHLARRVSASQAELGPKLSALARSIDGTIGSVRRIATELRPQILDRLGLLEAIRWQAREFEKRTGVHCRVDLPQAEIRWSPDHATALFRIFQESLTNIARHAGASSVEVSMRESHGRVELEIRDDGRGIRPEELGGAQSFGLLGMRERARMFGGTLRVDARPGQGTTIVAEIPV